MKKIENHTDEVLWDLCRQNDEFAFKSLFNRYYPFLVLVAARLVKDEFTAKDIAQHVFVTIWDKRSDILINSSVKSYLHRATINKSLNHLKSSRKTQSTTEILHVASKQLANKELESNELKKIIHDAIDRLPDRCRTIFILRRYEHLSYKEIADQLNISPRTVEVQLAKARKILRDLLAAYRYVLFYLLYHSDKGFSILDCLN